jgi:hypothetical protein
MQLVQNLTIKNDLGDYFRTQLIYKTSFFHSIVRFSPLPIRMVLPHNPHWRADCVVKPSVYPP